MEAKRQGKDSPSKLGNLKLHHPLSAPSNGLLAMPQGALAAWCDHDEDIDDAVKLSSVTPSCPGSWIRTGTQSAGARLQTMISI